VAQAGQSQPRVPYRHSVYSALPSAQAFCGDLVISPISHRRFMHFAHRHARARTLTCTHSPPGRHSSRARARARGRGAPNYSIPVQGRGRGVVGRGGRGRGTAEDCDLRACLTTARGRSSMTDRECPRGSARVLVRNHGRATRGSSRAGRQRALLQFDDSVPAFRPTTRLLRRSLPSFLSSSNL